MLAAAALLAWVVWCSPDTPAVGDATVGSSLGSGQPPTDIYDEPPKLLKQTRPKYPRAAYEQGIAGVVVLEILIDRDGRVAGVRVLESIPELDPAALDCVKKWRFKPALKAGQPVSVLARVPVSFRIHQKFRR